MKVLQFTDPHLYGRADGKLRGVETDATLHAAIGQAFAACPDFAAVLVTVGAAVLASVTKLNPGWMLLAGGVLGFAGLIG